MNPLYIDLAVCSIGLDDHCLVIKDKSKDAELARFKPREMTHDSIILQRRYGSISFAAISWLVAHSVNVAILDWKGNLKAQILPSEPVSNKLKIAHYKAYTERAKHLYISRTIIQSKVNRQREFLESLSRNFNIEIPKTPLIHSQSEDFIRNQEARYATRYFAEFGKVCKQLGHPFKGRGSKSNMHANDLPNALLNYSYGVLQTYVQRATNAVGLDNSLPFIHDVGNSRGLVFDLMELWRTNCDYSVLQALELLNNKKLRETAFEFTDNYEVLLNERAARMLFERVRFNLSLEEIILNCRILAKFMVGTEKSLSFSLKPIEVKPVFETDKVKQAVLSKSYKELGMNKSTLWYQRKMLKERGSLRLYNNTKQHYV